MKLKHIFRYTLLFCVIFYYYKTYSQESGAVRFLGHFISPSGGAYVAGCWGWTDTTTGREYALLGNECGTSIVEITNADNLVERDFIPGPCSIWREIQVHSHYTYVVTEAGGGTQIIDLSYLPDSAHLVKSYIYTGTGGNTSRAHTIHIKDGYMYLNGGSYGIGGVVIFSLADPENPAFQSAYQGNYFHDCFVRNNRIYGAAIGGIGVDIVDITTKTNPQHLYTISYPGAGTHNCATTDDGQFLLTTDEINSTPKTLKIWDLRNPPSFPKVAEYQGDPTATIHNVFVKGNLAFMSYYTAGLKIVDISDPTQPIEVGGYDTYLGTGGNYTGAWSAFPFFPSGKVIIGDMVSGMYVVDLNINAPKAPSDFSVYSDYLTPTSITLTWNDPETFISGSPLSNFKIYIYLEDFFIAGVDSGIQTYIDTGLVKHQQYRYKIRTVTTEDSSSLVTQKAYAGGAAEPSPPTNFTVFYERDGMTLSWKNPSTQIDGTPLNDIAYVDIFRDGELHISLPQTTSDTGQYQTYLDSIRGYHLYALSIRDNEIPENISEFTDSLIAYGGVNNSYTEGFESGKGDIYVNGTWDTTHTIAYSGSSSLTDSPYGNYSDYSKSYFITPPVVINSGMVLRFKHIALIALGDFGFVELSKDRNKTFSSIGGYNSYLHTEWQDGSADPGDWFAETKSLASYVNDTITIRFRIFSNAGVTADGWYIDDIFIGPSTTAADQLNEEIPNRYELEQNYPNPFNPTTTFTYSLPVRSYVTLKIYSHFGQEVVTLLQTTQEAGRHQIQWDGRNSQKLPVSSGLYIYRIEANGENGSHYMNQRKMLHLK